MNMRVGNNNALFLNFDNVRVAEVSVADSTLDRDSDTTVVVNRVRAAGITAPLPETLWVVRQEDGWRVGTEKPAKSERRLHFPGGGAALYHGEPLMVVWGTAGSEEASEKIFEIAKIARKSSRVTWPWGEAADMIYGRLPGKADTEVTAEDMAKYNLLLIGTAEQNSVVARLAEKLPVRIEDDKVVTADGFSWSFKDRAVGLLYYNPVAPQRLIYWVGSDSLAFYQRQAPLMKIQGWTAAGADLLVMHAEKNQTVAARRFDSRWNWENGYGESEVVDNHVASAAGHAAVMAGVFRRATGADFALMRADWDSQDMVLGAGETRGMDVASQFYDDLIAVMDLTGEEIVGAMASLEKPEYGNETCRFLPAPEGDLEPKRVYRVAMLGWMIWPYARATKDNPLSFRLTEQSVMEAVKRHWPEAVRTYSEYAAKSSRPTKTP